MRPMGADTSIELLSSGELTLHLLNLGFDSHFYLANQGLYRTFMSSFPYDCPQLIPLLQAQ
jgi:hypothetical protein